MRLIDLEFMIRPYERVILYDEYNNYLFDNYWCYCRFLYRKVISIHPEYDSIRCKPCLHIRIGGSLVYEKEDGY